MVSIDYNKISLIIKIKTKIIIIRQFFSVEIFHSTKSSNRYLIFKYLHKGNIIFGVF